jgi:hypothetical protein
VIRIEDPYGNLRSGDNGTVVTAARLQAAAHCKARTNLVAINGVITFTNLSHNVATNITVTFTSGSLTVQLRARLR